MLPVEKEDDAEGAPQHGQAHVQHNRRDIAGFLGPWRDELAESVAPQILVDGDGDEDGSNDGLVAVDGIGTCDSWQGGDLDTGASVANDDNNLERGSE